MVWDWVFLFWGPFEVLPYTSLPIKDWHGMVLSVQTEDHSDKTITVEEADNIAPLVSTKEKSVAQTRHVSVYITGLSYHICPHEDDFKVTILFLYTGACMKHFTMKCINSIQKSQCKNQTAPKSATKIIAFVITTKALVSRFSAACVQAFKNKKQHIKNINFRLHGYSAVYVLRAKPTDIEVERLRPNHEEVAYETLYEIRCHGERDLYLERLGNFLELCSDSVISKEEISQEN